jgi:hypothetical protein
LLYEMVEKRENSSTAGLYAKKKSLGELHR